MARLLTAFHTSPSSRTWKPCSSAAVNAHYSESHVIFNRSSSSLSFDDSPSPSSPRVLKRQTATTASFLGRGLHKKGGGRPAAAAARLIDPRSTPEDPTLRDLEDKVSEGASLTTMKWTWWQQGIRKGLGWNINNASWQGISINCWERAVVANEHDIAWCRPPPDRPWWRLLLRRLRARTRSIVSSCLCIQKQAPAPNLLYDPVSYSLNFDDGSHNNYHHSFLHSLHENRMHTVPPSSPRTRTRNGVPDSL